MSVARPDGARDHDERGADRGCHRTLHDACAAPPARCRRGGSRPARPPPRRAPAGREQQQHVPGQDRVPGDALGEVAEQHPGREPADQHQQREPGGEAHLARAGEPVRRRERRPATAGAATRSEGAATDSSDCVRSRTVVVAARDGRPDGVPGERQEPRRPSATPGPGDSQPRGVRQRDGGQDGEAESDRAEHLGGEVGPQPTPAGQVDGADAPARRRPRRRAPATWREQRLGGDQAGPQEERGSPPEASAGRRQRER